MKVLVCLPTYNEERNIAVMIDRISCTGLDLIVCDGHSTDATVVIAREKKIKVITRNGFGKGAAIRSAVKYALVYGYDVFVTIDCDQTYHPDDILTLLKFIPEYDMVIGIRKDITFLRKIANKIMTTTTNILYNAHLKDMASGLRAFKPGPFINYLTADSFDIEPQLTAVALRNQLKVKKYPLNILLE